MSLGRRRINGVHGNGRHGWEARRVSDWGKRESIERHDVGVRRWPRVGNGCRLTRGGTETLSVARNGACSINTRLIQRDWRCLSLTLTGLVSRRRDSAIQISNAKMRPLFLFGLRYFCNG